MKVFALQRQHLVRRPHREVFRFFEQPENLATITPPWLGFRIVTPSPVTMKKGAVIDYTITIAGKRIRWQSLISAYDPPYKFVDDQLRGPYTLWRHTHTFSETDGGTIISDEVHYALPFGPVGRIAHALFVQRQLETIFDYRARVIDQLFATDQPMSVRTSLQFHKGLQS